MLDNLVISALSTSTLNKSISIALDGESVLADVNPPDVLDSAGAFAVNTLDLVCFAKRTVSCTPCDRWKPISCYIPFPIMAFFNVAPLSRIKTASASPPSAWPVHETPRPYVFIPPSKVPLML